MNLDLEKLKEIYGDSLIEDISSNVGNLTRNMEYLRTRNIASPEEVVELYPYAFLDDEETFREKVDNIIFTLGIEYVEKLKNDMTLWELLDG